MAVKILRLKEAAPLIRICDLPEVTISDGLDPIRRTKKWLEEVIANPHPDLGRDGPMCPFVLGALIRATVWFQLSNFGCTEVTDSIILMRQLMQQFLQLDPKIGKDSKFRTILVLFPNVTATEAPIIIDVVQRHLKLEFVSAGLMIGEFHDLVGTPSLNNPNFFPLRTRTPMLVIREMVAMDVPFLTEKAAYLKAYLDRFGDMVPERYKGTVMETMTHFALCDLSNH